MRVSSVSQNFRIDSNIRSIQRDLADVQSQISTGKKAQVYSGLSASESRMSINLRAALEQRDSFTTSINTSNSRMKVMDHALTNIQTVISDFRSDLLTHQNSMADDPAGTLKVLAENSISLITDFLNTKSDGRYLFNGYDSSTPPMRNVTDTNADFVSFLTDETATAATVDGLAERFFGNHHMHVDREPQTIALTAAPMPGVNDAITFTIDGVSNQITLTSNTMAAASTELAAALETSFPGKVDTVDVIDGELHVDFAAGVSDQVITFGDAADTFSDAFVSTSEIVDQPFSLMISDGITAEYGYMAHNESFSDAMEVLYTFANSDQVADFDNNIETLIGTALTKVDSVFNDINDMVGILGADRQMMADKLVEHEDFSLMLQSQIADIEDVDQAEAISRFQMLQTQLQTSFQLTSILRQMTLADFI